MQLHLTLRTMTRLAVSASLLAGGLLAGGGLVQAQPVPGPMMAGPSVPAGWVFQGTFHDGHWDGQWVPGAPGAMQPGAYAPPPPMDYHMDRETRHMMERCHDDHPNRKCDRFFHDHPELADGPHGPPPAYGQMPYGPMPYGAAPMGYMMMPVMQPAQPPYTETKTVTTTYVTDSRVVHHYHVVHRHPRDKRVYTGS